MRKDSEMNSLIFLIKNATHNIINSLLCRCRVVVSEGGAENGEWDEKEGWIVGGHLMVIFGSE